jgi:flagellar hook-length control protein FliK
MNAVNLLALLFSPSGNEPTQLQHSGSTTQPDMEFLLLLEQQIWRQQLPKAAQTELGSSFGQSLAESAESLSAAMLATASAQDGTNVQPNATTPVTVQLDTQGFFDALLSSLRQLLGAGMREQATTPVPVESSIQLAATASNSSTQQLDESATAKPTPTPVQPESALQIKLLECWSKLISELNAKYLGQDTTSWHLASSRFAVSLSSINQPALPWTTGNSPSQDGSAWAANTTLQQQLLQVNQPGTQPSAVLANVLLEAPASIRWFASLGSASSLKSAEMLPTGEVATTASTPQAVPLSAWVQLEDGNILQVSIQALSTGSNSVGQQSQAQVPQLFNLSIKQLGEDASILTAQLSVWHDDSLQFPGISTLPIGTQPVAEPRLSSIWNTQPFQQTTAGAVAGTNGELLSEVQAGNLPAATNADEAYIRLLTVDPEVAHKQALPITASSVSTMKQTPVLLSPATTASDKLPVQYMPSGTAVAELPLNDELSVEIAPPASSSAAELRRQSGERLGASWSGSSIRPAVVLSDSAMAPAAVAADSVPTQLMQFSGSRFEVIPFSGLQYLELAERVMGRVAGAKASGNGNYHARLDLNPPNLGKLVVNISVRGDSVALQLACLSNVPKEQLKDSLEALRQSLEDAGLNVTELRIDEVDADEERNSGGQGQENAHDGQHAESGQETIVSHATPVVSHNNKVTPLMEF